MSAQRAKIARRVKNVLPVIHAAMTMLPMTIQTRALRLVPGLSLREIRSCAKTARRVVSHVPVAMITAVMARRVTMLPVTMPLAKQAPAILSLVRMRLVRMRRAKIAVRAGHRVIRPGTMRPPVLILRCCHPRFRLPVRLTKMSA